MPHGDPHQYSRFESLLRRRIFAGGRGTVPTSWEGRSCRARYSSLLRTHNFWVLWREQCWSRLGILYFARSFRQHWQWIFDILGKSANWIALKRWIPDQIQSLSQELPKCLSRHRRTICCHNWHWDRWKSEFIHQWACWAWLAEPARKSGVSLRWKR